VYLVFADDAKQRPTRPGMGPLIGAGAILVEGSKVSGIEKGIHKLCEEAGFPTTDPKKSEFKWSPVDPSNFDKASLARFMRLA
jgi:hypothetical protein